MNDQLRRLLDQVDRLDNEAEPGPWEVEYEAEGGDQPPSVLRVDPDDRCHLTLVAWAEDDPDAELIALSRTALPAIAKALRAVIDEVQNLHLIASTQAVLDGSKSSAAYAYWESGNRVKQAITDALGGDDNGDQE